MKIFVYDQEALTYKKLGKKSYIIASSVVSVLCVVFFFLGTISGSVYITNKIHNQEIQKDNYMSKHDLSPEEHAAWKDSTFKDYKKRADLFLKRPKFEGTPLNGEILSLCARNAYDSTGVLLPLELALSQAIWESSMGREGKSPKNNPFNIGEHDSGTVQYFNSTFEGTQAYYYYMCRDYLSCRTLDELFYSFTNCGGHRYASSPTYEEHIRGQYYVIKGWIDKNVK